MTPVKYALKNMSMAIWINAVFALQMIVVLFLFAESGEDIILFARGVGNVRFLQENGAYIVSDTTSSERRMAIWNREAESIEKARDLFRSIKDCACPTFTVWSYATGERAGPVVISQFVADPPFFDVLAIRFHAGGSTAFGEAGSQEIPMVVGYGLQDIFSVGESYEIMDYSASAMIAVKVCGVMDKNSIVPSLRDMGGETDLNYACIIPIREEHLGDLANLDMAIGATVIFTGDMHALSQLERLSTDLGLYDIRYIPIGDSIAFYREWLVARLQSYGLAVAVVLAFSLGSLAINLMSFMNRNMGNFAVHLRCGATRRQLFMQLFAQVCIGYVPALLLVLLVHGASLTSLISIAFSAILILAVNALPFFTFMKLDIVSAAQRSRTQ